MRRFTGEYAEDGKARRLAVRESAGHRCIRCGHPFESGKHGRGEWSPCDEQCAHQGALRIEVDEDEWVEDEWTPKNSKLNAGDLIYYGIKVEAKWRILTVHHLDGDKANDSWWNTLALCQRCHLTIQTRVDPNTPWMFEHSLWFKPYAAGFYAHKYEGLSLTREEAMLRMDELLAYELKTV